MRVSFSMNTLRYKPRVVCLLLSAPLRPAIGYAKWNTKKKQVMDLHCLYYYLYNVFCKIKFFSFTKILFLIKNYHFLYINKKKHWSRIDWAYMCSFCRTGSRTGSRANTCFVTELVKSPTAVWMGTWYLLRDSLGKTFSTVNAFIAGL